MKIRFVSFVISTDLSDKELEEEIIQAINNSGVISLDSIEQKTICCEDYENHTKGPIEMKETAEKESGIKYFKCTECDHEISIMLQSTI